MKKLRYYIAFFIAKLIQHILKLLKKNATHFPGKVAIILCPDFLKHVGKPDKIVCVTGTNGKTTVCNLLRDILMDNDYDILDNKLGSNVNSGIASALIFGTSWRGKSKKKLAVFEVDERSSKLIYPYINPDYLVCTNLFRDSIQRNAHPDFIVNIMHSAIPTKTKLILNADDLISCNLGNGNEKVFFGIGKLDTDLKESKNLINDRIVCPKCYTKLEYNYARYHHIGTAYCPNCNFKSPKSDYLVTNIDYEHKKITLNNNENETYNINATSIFNIYNILAAIVLLKELGLEYNQINNSLEKSKIVSTRISEENINGLDVILHLAKGQNPVAASRVLDFVVNEKGRKTVILILDDVHDKKCSSENIAWLYGTDFELLNSDDIKQIIIGGVRSSDYALRLLIAGIPKEKIFCVEDEQNTVNCLETENIDKLFILHDIYNYDIACELKDKVRNMKNEKGSSV